MGKFYLFLVIGFIFLSGYVLMNSSTAEEDTMTSQIGYQEFSLVQDITQSGHNILVGTLRSDFTFRGTQSNVALDGGLYSNTATGPADGPVHLRTQGRYGDSYFEINSVLTRTMGDRLDALTVEGPLQEVRDSGSLYAISGNDVQLDGSSPGTGPAVHAILATEGDAYSSFASALNSSQVVGVGGIGDIIQNIPERNLATLKNEILSHPSLVVTNGNENWGFSNTIGNSGSPAIRVVRGDVVMSGNARGFGILFIDDGNLTMTNTASWRGLIVMNAQGNELILTDRASIVGAVVATSTEGEFEIPSTGGLPGGHFDVDVFPKDPSSPDWTDEEYHEHEYDDKYNVIGVDLLSAGCDSGSPGGLCFNDLVLSRGYAQVRAEFFNASSSSGTYTFNDGSGPITGSPQSGFNRTFNPANLTEFNIQFDWLCSLRGTDPGTVQSAAGNRDNAFAVRIYDTATNNLIYELAVYHHIKKNNDVCADDPGSIDSIERRSFIFDISQDASIRYSSQALTQINLSSLNDLRPQYTHSNIVSTKITADNWNR